MLKPTESIEAPVVLGKFKETHVYIWTIGFISMRLFICYSLPTRWSRYGQAYFEEVDYLPTRCIVYDQWTNTMGSELSCKTAYQGITII